MRILPALSKAEQKAQQDFQVLLLRYLEVSSNEKLENSILKALTKNGFSPKLEVHEHARVTLGELFEILALIDNAEFNADFLKLAKPTEAPLVGSVKPTRKTQPKDFTETSKPKFYDLDPMDDDYP